MNVGLVTAVVSLASVFIGGFSFLARLLWKTSSEWTAAALNITALTMKLDSVVTEKETDHNKLENRIDRVEARVSTHETWHAQQRGRFVL